MLISVHTIASKSPPSCQVFPPQCTQDIPFIPKVPKLAKLGTYMPRKVGIFLAWTALASFASGSEGFN